MGVQAPTDVILIRPSHFLPNPETAADNQFQALDHPLPPETVSRRAFQECNQVAETIEALGVQVHLFDDDRTDRPDSVFPNNWLSTHSGGHIALYPMYSPNRRLERRADIVSALKEHYRVQEVVDFSGLEHDGIFLEGTGAMVLDHVARVAYVCRSNRANPIALERFCTRFGYEPMAFDAVDQSGTPVYHTNVMMCIGTDLALVADDMILDSARRNEILDRVARPGRSIVRLTHAQIGAFAGNAIELDGSNGRFLAMSTTAQESLTVAQRRAIEAAVPIVAVDVSTIELAGGSLRCMIAGVHLERRPMAVAG